MAIRVNAYLLITLNVNVLNFPIKRHGMAHFVMRDKEGHCIKIKGSTD